VSHHQEQTGADFVLQAATECLMPVVERPLRHCMCNQRPSNGGCHHCPVHDVLSWWMGFGCLPLPACNIRLCCICVAGLSTYLPLRKEPPLVSDANLKTPMFMAHGDADYTVRGSQHDVALRHLPLDWNCALKHMCH